MVFSNIVLDERIFCMINCRRSTVHNRNWVNNDRTEDFTSDHWKGEGEKAKKYFKEEGRGGIKKSFAI